MKRFFLPILIAWGLAMGSALDAQQPGGAELISAHLRANLSRYELLYMHLHENPELSYREFATAERMAEEMEKLGFDVTRNFGGTGIVGIFLNGSGPVLLLRTDMDALPIEEKTGWAFASRVKAENDRGDEVHVMHACGHDLHMTVWVGVANTLVGLKDHWSGTLVMIAQPAEEKSGGANDMIREGLFRKFPVPDYGLAFHVSPELPSNTVGYCPGPAFAGVSSVDITIFGEGGHGAYPHKTIDPVVLASRTILDLQTIVSREISPLETAVVTVGSVHGGTQHNIIPDRVDLQLTLRFYNEQVYRQTTEAIHRITRGIAISAGLPEAKYPLVLIPDSYTPPVVNDIELTEKAAESFLRILGDRNVILVEPTMAGEDFGKYGQTPEEIPIFLGWLGTVNPEKFNQSLQEGTYLPPLHSPYFAPDYRNAIVTGIKAMSMAAMDLLSGPER